MREAHHRCALHSDEIVINAAATGFDEHVVSPRTLSREGEFQTIPRALAIAAFQSRGLSGSLAATID
jgi:hypothetical protein